MRPESFLNFVAFQTLVVLFLASAVVMWLKPKAWAYALAAFLGALCGWLSARTDEMFAVAFFLLAFSFFAGFAQRRHVWGVALIIGIWVPIFGLVAQRAGLAHGGISAPTVIMPLLFAMAGAYAGAGVQKVGPSLPQQA